MKRLVLQKETVRTLTADDLQRIVTGGNTGGGLPTDTVDPGLGTSPANDTVECELTTNCPDPTEVNC